MPRSKTILQISVLTELDGVLQQPVALTRSPHSRGKEALVPQKRGTVVDTVPFLRLPGALTGRLDFLVPIQQRMSMVVATADGADSCKDGFPHTPQPEAEYGSGYGLDPAAATGASGVSVRPHPTIGRGGNTNLESGQPRRNCEVFQMNMKNWHPQWGDTTMIRQRISQMPSNRHLRRRSSWTW